MLNPQVLCCSYMVEQNRWASPKFLLHQHPIDRNNALSFRHILFRIWRIWELSPVKSIWVRWVGAAKNDSSQATQWSSMLNPQVPRCSYMVEQNRWASPKFLLHQHPIDRNTALSFRHILFRIWRIWELSPLKSIWVRWVGAAKND